MEALPERRAAACPLALSHLEIMEGWMEGVRERRKDRRWWWGWESESALKTFNSPQSPELRTPVCSSCWVELLLLDPAGTKSTKPVVRQQTPAAVQRIISDSVIHCELTDFIDQLMKNEITEPLNIVEG